MSATDAPTSEVVTVKGHRYTIVTHGGIDWVSSRTQPGTFHRATIETCDCTLFGFRRACPHIAAVSERNRLRAQGGQAV